MSVINYNLLFLKDGHLVDPFILKTFETLDIDNIVLFLDSRTVLVGDGKEFKIRDIKTGEILGRIPGMQYCKKDNYILIYNGEDPDKLYKYDIKIRSLVDVVIDYKDWSKVMVLICIKDHRIFFQESFDTIIIYNLIKKSTSKVEGYKISDNQGENYLYSESLEGIKIKTLDSNEIINIKGRRDIENYFVAGAIIFYQTRSGYFYKIENGETRLLIIDEGMITSILYKEYHDSSNFITDMIYIGLNQIIITTSYGSFFVINSSLERQVEIVNKEYEINTLLFNTISEDIISYDGYLINLQCEKSIEFEKDTIYPFISDGQIEDMIKNIKIVMISKNIISIIAKFI